MTAQPPKNRTPEDQSHTPQALVLVLVLVLCPPLLSSIEISFHGDLLVSKDGPITGESVPLWTLGIARMITCNIFSLTLSLSFSLPSLDQYGKAYYSFFFWFGGTYRREGINTAPRGPPFSLFFSHRSRPQPASKAGRCWLLVVGFCCLFSPTEHRDAERTEGLEEGNIQAKDSNRKPSIVPVGVIKKKIRKKSASARLYFAPCIFPQRAAHSPESLPSPSYSLLQSYSILHVTLPYLTLALTLKDE